MPTPHESIPTPPADFEQLRSKVQTELLDNDGVFSLVRDVLQHENETADLPDFQLDVSYPTVQASDFEKPDDIDPLEYFGMGFVITGSTTTKIDSGLPTMSVSYGICNYIELGYYKRDRTGVALFDDAGRLHELPVEDGGAVIPKGAVEGRRIDALNAWSSAHNQMVRAAKTNPDMHIDSLTKVWTDEQSFSVEEM